MIPCFVVYDVRHGDDLEFYLQEKQAQQAAAEICARWGAGEAAVKAGEAPAAHFGL